MCRLRCGLRVALAWGWASLSLLSLGSPCLAQKTGTAPTVAAASAPGAVPQPAAAPPADAAAGTNNRFVLAEGVVRLAPGAQGGEASFIVSAEQLGKDLMAAPAITLTDLNAKFNAGAAKVSFRTEPELQAVGTTRKWLVTAMVSDLALNTEQSRYALVTLGAVERAVPYMLSNRPRVTPDFTVAVNSPWVISGPGDEGTVIVSTGEQAVSGLRIANSTLTEKTMGTPIRIQQLELCRSAAEPCVAPAPIPALTSQTLYLRITDGKRPNGRFSGTLSFAVDARPEAKPVTLEATSSSTAARLGGAALIVLGVLAAWQLTVFSRARFDRLSVLKPATAARARIESLLARLDKVRSATGIDLPQLRSQYIALADGLSEYALDRDGLLPGLWPPIWRTDVPDLKPRLLALEQPIAGLTVVVGSGAEVLAPLWTAAQAAADRANVEAGLRLLDVPADAATEAKAQALVALAISRASPPPPGVQSAAQQRTQSAALLLERISSEMQSLSAGVWLAYLMLVSVAGTALLIVNNPGFGTLMDMVYCLFWGFGMPVTLDKLQQISPAGVSTSLGISLPK